MDALSAYDNHRTDVSVAPYSPSGWNVAAFHEIGNNAVSTIVFHVTLHQNNFFIINLYIGALLCRSQPLRPATFTAIADVAP